MRNVLVTGASRGLGLAIARRLADDGYRVLAVARRPSEPLIALIEEMGGEKGAVRFYPFDLSDVEALPDLVRRLKAEHKSFYGLVNNAGASIDGLLANTSQAQIEALFRLNTLAPIMLTKLISRSMMAQGTGRVVNMSSVVAATGLSGLAVYGATKGALAGFTKSLARELGRAGVTVNAVAPGFIETELTSGMDAAEKERVIRRSPLRRLAAAEDVAAAVAYLLSDGGRNVTGTVLTVDAGSTA